jgi:RimJ/RimL family protein N-acetyltransferase
VSSSPDVPGPALKAPIRTGRLLLRAGRVEDAADTFAYRRLDRVAHWLTSQPSDLEAYRASFADPGRLADTVIVERDGLVIGDLMLRVEDAWAQTEVADRARRLQAELGWALHPDYTGQGYATEALTALLAYCFGDLGLRRVTASAFADNHASRRLMERLGMRLETYTVRESLHRSGEWLDGVTYALLADEWAR